MPRVWHFVLLKQKIVWALTSKTETFLSELRSFADVPVVVLLQKLLTY